MSKLLPSQALSDWPEVDIDQQGVFKYVHIECYAEDEKDGQVCLIKKFQMIIFSLLTLYVFKFALYPACLMVSHLTSLG